MYNKIEAIKKAFNDNLERFKMKYPDHKIVKLDIPPHIRAKTLAWAMQVAISKKEEELYQEDPGMLISRFAVGILIEAVFEYYYNLQFVDWSIGNTKNFAYPDLKKAGYKLGLKGSSKPNMPLVPVQNEYNKDELCPQLICIYDQDAEQIWVLGIASTDILEKFSYTGFVKSNNVNTNIKTAFYGFSYLEPFKGLESLEPYRIVKENI